MASAWVSGGGAQARGYECAVSYGQRLSESCHSGRPLRAETKPLAPPKMRRGSMWLCIPKPAHCLLQHTHHTHHTQHTTRTPVHRALPMCTRRTPGVAAPTAAGSPRKTDVSLVTCRLTWRPPQRQRSSPVPRIQFCGLQPGPGGLAAGGTQRPRPPRRAGTGRASPSPQLQCHVPAPPAPGLRGGPPRPHTRPRSEAGRGRATAVTRGVFAMCRQASA